ncbi:unnamed protein product [Parnassius mnemosyne]|uniref:Odorant receptor n=1 Tax=Parnassius mnemosyne TaxID=213953 RepID=A0AAV1LTE5_9NEOP
MLKKFKAFLNKENFDSSNGFVDPYKYHFTCYYILKYFQVVDNEPIPKWTYFFLTFMAICVIIALGLLSLTVYHGIDTNDLQIITEGGCYFIVIFYEMLMLLCTIINLQQYHVLLRTLRADFKYVCSEGVKYRDRFFENQLNTWKFSIFSVIFTSSIGGGVALFTSLCLLWHVATHEPGDGSKRPLFFPFWYFETDFSASPLYEISFIYSNFCALAYAYSYIFMLQTQVLWIGEIMAKADLIIWYIQDLMEGLDLPKSQQEADRLISVIKSRMREIVREHHSMYKLLQSYTTVYKKLLMFEQKLSGPVICLTAYCTAEQLKVGEVNGILMLLCGGAIIQVFIPTYLCTILGIKVRSIGDACLDIPFWNIGRVIRPYMVLIMQKSLRPLQLSAPGFEEVSVQTFSKTMASAYSFFNMLRQTDL